MSLLPTVNARGVLASRPAAAAANEGYNYFATDSGTGTLYRSNGSSWDINSGSGGLADQGVATYLDWTVAAAPATPASGKVRTYAKTGKTFAQKDDAGVETIFGAGGGGGAPTGAEYLTTAADGTLSAEVVIPGLVASPDRIPSGVTSLDFDSSTSGLTADGSPTTFASDTSKESQLFTVCTTASALQGGHAAWTPSAGHAAWIKITAADLPASFARVGVLAEAASPGGCSGVFFRRNGANYDFEWRDYSAPATPVNNGSQAVTPPWGPGVNVFFGPLWLMVVWNSNTSLTFRFSLDGIVFRSLGGTFVAHAPSSAFTTGAAGVGMEGEGTAGRSWVDYLRYGDPAAAGLYLP